jgi:hypothetical protein
MIKNKYLGKGNIIYCNTQKWNNSFLRLTVVLPNKANVSAFVKCRNFCCQLSSRLKCNSYYDVT